MFGGGSSSLYYYLLEAFPFQQPADDGVAALCLCAIVLLHLQPYHIFALISFSSQRGMRSTNHLWHPLLFLALFLCPVLLFFWFLSLATAYAGWQARPRHESASARVFWVL
ncbi:hypothetical protein BD289DRAFT_442853 [Coniella lustricola]|uniref:Uncharacterized protein n=1 Tax=Coniella lustricola TaxID=2025994 RepID=A0A2T2ZXP7_9PEZI|nr:hypothetical protein BD289DRAFT_442853 [Coniella lustricola]